MSTAVTILGTSVLAVLLAGYLAQRYMPPPKPKVVGIDLGTTFSCIAVYCSGTGDIQVIGPNGSHKCIPSVVAFRGDIVLVGFEAVSQAETNADNTIYDAKRFIGKKFTQKELDSESKRYQFKMQLDNQGNVNFLVGPKHNKTLVSPEIIGAHVLGELKSYAEKNLSSIVKVSVMTVPAEFDERQRNASRNAASMAGFDVWRVINEPTAAALAYGLHKKEGTQIVLVVDLGGGTLDVSLLYIQGGMFLTQAMAGNNHLGGQDFNQRLMLYLLKLIQDRFGAPLVDPEDIQILRHQVEEIKLNLTNRESVILNVQFHSLRDMENKPVNFIEKVARTKFEDLNDDLFQKVLEPIKAVLKDVELTPLEIDEVVLVGGSTRIPKIRHIIRDFFQKDPNVSIDPDMAVVSGVAVQAGIVTNAWPVRVSAIELPTRAKKIHIG